jgi:cyclophilin family peptidyl-prolyl cis-trans isomerase
MLKTGWDRHEGDFNAGRAARQHRYGIGHNEGLIDVARILLPPDDTRPDSQHWKRRREAHAMQWVRFTLIAALVPLAASTLIGCSRKSADQPAVQGEAASAPQAAGSVAVTPASATRVNQKSPKPIDPMVVLHTSAGDITLRLFADQAPRTVENFLTAYAQRGFYDQTIFHHVEPGVMLIGGGYAANFEAKPTRAAIYNESNNRLSNRRGTVAMIREPDAPHSATSQFFINLADNAQFDWQSTEAEDVPGYCVFGEVTHGMDVVDRIAQLATSSHAQFSSVPSPTVAITSVDRLQ